MLSVLTLGCIGDGRQLAAVLTVNSMQWCVLNLYNDRSIIDHFCSVWFDSVFYGRAATSGFLSVFLILFP